MEIENSTTTWNPIRYVTYDPADGRLTGCYIQELQPEHADAYILYPDGIAMWWPLFRANADRSGVEVITMPERVPGYLPPDPEPEEPTEPEEPPADPEPE